MEKHKHQFINGECYFCGLRENGSMTKNRYVVVGYIIDDLSKINYKEKPYKSKQFKSSYDATKHGYSLVYQKDGNTKRTKNVLVNFQIETIK